MQNPDLTAAVADLRGEYPDRDFIVVSRGIERQLHTDLTNLVKDKKHSKVVLFLTTYGGDPHGGFRFARCLRHNYEHVRLVVPSFCKSAGTLIAIAANELAIGDFGELGPLDVQVIKPSELAERGSGLEVMEALNISAAHAQQVFSQNLVDLRQSWRLSTKLAGEFAGILAAAAVQPLYAQIDPARLGEMQRAMRIALEYGARLSAHSQSLKPGSLEQLVGGYPSHSFVIDRKEAKQLFNSVHTPTVAESKICSILWSQLSEQRHVGPMFLPEIQPEGESDVDQPSEAEAGTAGEAAAEPASGQGNAASSDE
ncbi:SDH family Clp fold serine proteinase [Burkholderia gladioli]|uniref:SDH family Clp fold serine proteinase n=1 Tax=Burkholderia gladioli TaxID=28095 RepID=UPI0016404D62|nr:hypothetical protein [Burkholderia gladioli]MDN7751770.1 hypothetical protein [Burkholderia gladioli]